MLQKEALDILKLGHNVFLTGAAGSGKTHTLRAYIKYLRQNNIEVAITASTGIAATHIGGTTIHAWSGLGIKDRLTEYDLELMQEKKQLWKRYQDTQVLIIDEISMLHHFRFDLLNKLAQTFKRNTKPFGGMQIVLCGDFFQLPPVSRFGEPPAYFAYRSEIWKKMDLKICYLSEQHRQNDDLYLSLLNAIRANEVDDDSLQSLRDRYKKDIELENIEPTKLSTHNEDVDSINIKELSKVKGEERVFVMEYTGKGSLVETLKKSCLAPENLGLKVGARVMFVKNNADKGYVNGTLGVVDSFSTTMEPVVRIANGRKITVMRDSWAIEEDGKIKAELKQYPLRLAWAITIHKSQGMSLDAAEIDLSRAFAPGMGYVALSRVKSLAGLKLTGFSHTALQIHPEVLEIDKDLREQSDDAVADLIELTENFGQEKLTDLQEAWVREHASAKPIKGFSGFTGTGNNSDIDVDEDSDFTTDKIAEAMRKQVKNSSQLETLSYLTEKKNIEEIATDRKLKPETILEHIEFLVDQNLMQSSGVDLVYLKNTAFKGPRGHTRFTKIKQAFLDEKEKMIKQIQGTSDQSISHISEFRLAPIKNKLGNSFSYFEIRLARILLRDDLLDA